MICAIILLGSCAATKESQEPKIYKQQLKEGKLTKGNYNFNVKGYQDLLTMKRIVKGK